ncbi:PREDICTED: uncharacterized protein LOC18598330 [Theobroma cacao]|uniref:Uncharacterized protein LOC18598330 n=1 Tax=Theobroma cacao TaxID=3641 RepID=A0AB32WC70_THECC|nr:PREDICTED: uncharacterized protein LOC18598330 [Theobroma cacao]
MKVITFVTSTLKYFLQNMESPIRLHLPITHRLIVKLKYPTEKSREFWRRLCVHEENTSPRGWMIALWAYRTVYKTLIEMSPYKLVFEKACHFPVELKHNAYCVIKKLKFDLHVTGEKCLLQFIELDEFHLQAYENAKLYKERTKRWHEKKIIEHHFE